MNNLDKFKIYLTERLSQNSVTSYIAGLRYLSKDYGSDILQISDITQANKLKERYGLQGDKRSVGEYGNGTARNAMNKYANFLEDSVSLVCQPTQSISNPIPESNRKFTYEHDLHITLETQISELFPGYSLVGSEYSIEGVRIDLLLERDNELLVIELKAGIAKYEVFGQISMYLGLIQDKFPDYKVYGLIIANEIHKGLTAACKTNASISCKKYTMKLALDNA